MNNLVTYIWRIQFFCIFMYLSECLRILFSAHVGLVSRSTCSLQCHTFKKKFRRQYAILVIWFKHVACVCVCVCESCTCCFKNFSQTLFKESIENIQSRMYSFNREERSSLFVSSPSCLSTTKYFYESLLCLYILYIYMSLYTIFG